MIWSYKKVEEFIINQNFIIMYDLICLLLVIIVAAGEEAVLIDAWGKLHAPHCLLDWICWLLSISLAAFVGWTTYSMLPCSFSLSMPILVLFTALSVLLFAGLSWGGVRLAQKYN